MEEVKVLGRGRMGAAMHRGIVLLGRLMVDEVDVDAMLAVLVEQGSGWVWKRGDVGVEVDGRPGRYNKTMPTYSRVQ